MSHIFAPKTDYAFYQTVFAIIAVAATMLWLSLRIYQLSGLYLEILIHKIIDACGCADMAHFLSMHPAIFGAVIVFGIIIGIFVFYSLYKLIKLASSTKKYAAHYLYFAEAEYSVKLKAAIKDLGLDGKRIIEINHPELTVFCFGFRHPKICISRALVCALDMGELKAVLAHERQHMISSEPLKLFIVKYFRSVFFFLPGMESCVKKYITLSELSADEKASGSAADRLKLAGAILKISGQEDSRRVNGRLSPLYSGSVIAERANRLVDETYIPKFKFLNKRLVAGSLVLAAVFLSVFAILSDSTKAFEDHNNSGCISGGSQSGDQKTNSFYNPADRKNTCDAVDYGDPKNSVCRETSCGM